MRADLLRRLRGWRSGAVACAHCTLAPSESGAVVAQWWRSGAVGWSFLVIQADFRVIGWAFPRVKELLQAAMLFGFRQIPSGKKSPLEGFVDQ